MSVAMARPLFWIKYWLDSLHNPKLIRLSLAERGAWWGLLGLAGELDAGGALVSGGQPLTPDEIGDLLHIRAADRPHLNSMVEKMVVCGSLTWNGQALQVTNWEERQATPHWLTREGMAERQRQCRERRRLALAHPPTPPLKDGEEEGEGESHTHVTVTEYERAAGARKLWKKVLPRLRRQVTEANFGTWLRNTKALGYDPDGLLVVEVETEAQADNLNRSLYSLAQRTLMKITGEPADIQFVCCRGAKEPVTSAGQIPVTRTVQTPVTPVTPVTGGPISPVTPVTKDRREAVRERVRRYRERARVQELEKEAEAPVVRHEG